MAMARLAQGSCDSCASEIEDLGAIVLVSWWATESGYQSASWLHHWLNNLGQLTTIL